MTDVQIEFISGFNEDEKQIALNSIDLLRGLINSVEFKNEVLSVPKFKKNKIVRITGNKKYSNQEILDLILSGQDLNSPPDGVINLKVSLYDGERNEIGNTNMNSLEICTYRGYFKEKGEKYYASHLLHEYMHVIGFTHGMFDLIGKRDKTVPYKIGKIAIDILTGN